ncbi:hypothetical protein ACFP81_07110 [Deinococcus lacus]|uniref:Uncharacterized protein n=1 Tax=Deinococcus lacus TaxID=392561 RepID=A0ABW1YC43_9DEIO
MSDDKIRRKLTSLAAALRQFHSALLDVARSDYEFAHGKVQNPFELFNLVTTHPDFQWLRPLSGLMATLDEVTDEKGLILTERHVNDVEHALGLLFAESDTRFQEFRQGYARAAQDPKVRETEGRWREVLSSLEA